MFDWLRDLGKSQEEKRQERLNAYLDNTLTPRERQALEQELTRDEPLRTELEQLRLFKAAVRSLPRVTVPRHFTLTPEMAGQTRRPQTYSLYPTLRLATALTAFLLVALLAFELLLPMQSGSMANDMANNAEVAMDGAAANDTFDNNVADAGDDAAESAPQVMAESEGEEEAVEEPMEEVAVEEADEAAAAPSAGAVQTTVEATFTPTPTPTVSITPSPTSTATPSPTPMPRATPLPEPPATPLSPLRGLQIALVVIFLVLLIVTITVRGRGRMAR